MEVSIALTHEPIPRPPAWAEPLGPETGALVEFFGLVRATENSAATGPAAIDALHYEAHGSMAEKIMREKIAGLQKRHPCQAVQVIHRLGPVRVGEAAIYVGIRSRHRGEAFRFLQEFMDELKKDVPIWKQVA